MTSKELVVSAKGDKLKVALLCDGDLTEYRLDRKEDQISVGDVFIGKVKNLAAGVNAAFVDIGHEKDAFLHYTDLGPQFFSLNKYFSDLKSGKKVNLEGLQLGSDLDKTGKIEDVLSKDQEVIVQIQKEPIHNKGARLSAEITFAGRYIILLPFSNKVSISRKVSSPTEKIRLKRLLESMRPKNFGIVVRTVADGKDASDFGEDIDRLLESWKTVVSKVPITKPKNRVVSEISMVSTVLRDVLSESFDKIVVDDINIFTEMRNYILKIAPEKEKILALYNKSTNLFEDLGIEKQLRILFGRTVSLPEGGYLVIEKTEAMHVIDVNSGSRSVRDGDQEDSILKMNLNAAKEVARQLKLRDLGGIIVVDFIDMKSSESKACLESHLSGYLKDDRSKIKILPISKFGLVQITRHRVREEVYVDTSELCSACNGKGKVKSTLTIIDDIDKNIKFLTINQNEKNISVLVHPYIAICLKSGFMSTRVNWFFKHMIWVKIRENSKLGINEVKYLVKRDGSEVMVSLGKQLDKS